ncbi:cilia- and flagella-associated protein 263 isoform X5 [Erythrolamprus reginae]|uniref:cilia- and flagella-associated protein 263 isoform X5 n=1 Tax=Erythrolamprus reginae TaxID=121349 RepID=UPI00396CDD14
MEALGEKTSSAARGLLRPPCGEARAASGAMPGEATCWPPGLGRVSGSAMGDEESERDSVHTGESHEGAEELHVELAQLTTEQLQALVEENSHTNYMLKIETEMFEKFFNRLEPKDLGPEKRGSSLDLAQAPYPRGRRKSKSRITTDRVILLTVEQKCDLVQRDLDETKEYLQLMKDNSEKSLQNYLATLEEADIRLAEIKRAIIEFDKDIVKTIIKKKGSVIASDKVLRYMEDRIRCRDVMKEKIYLKNASLKVQKKKMQMQLKQEREKAEDLNKKLRRQLAEYKVPPVLNYVHEKMTVHDLENSLRIWERKVEIVEMALKSYRNVWLKAKMASHQLQTLLPEQERRKATEGF